ncbi:MAG: hypothetical protein UZ14_CFX002003170 [Chloroflexi bacterium OLB14]|nr:MAG: hypothetical protein UZ14_CFX002003170 [Chloroflexi bacterium OLB14]
MSVPLWYITYMIEQTGPPIELTIILVCFCGLFVLVLGVVVLGFIVRKDAGKNNKEDKL